MKPSPALPFSRVVLLALTLLALALGGATELWEQALMAVLMAGLIILAPPNRSLGMGISLLFVALFVLATAAFLPANWSSSSPWRQRLVTDLAMSLVSIRTPQPWLTAQACCFLFVGLVWAYYVLSQNWTGERRLAAARFLVFGVALLATAAVTAFAFGFHVPTWNQEENRGWFQNRNQTADVLAVCGVINYALIYDYLRKGRVAGYVWLLTLAIIGAALVISYSRAGILLFFGGILIWHLWPVPGQKRNPSWAKRTTLSTSLIVLLFTLFLLFGGDTLERFEGHELPRSVHESFRFAIQKDAFRFSLQSPWLGVGLGNFEPLFAHARHDSINQDRTIHPESDWLWAACEMGWLAPLIFLTGIIWWLKKCLPFQVKSGESLRRALTVAGLLFIVHGFVDVSGHRLGSFMMGFLVLSLALPESSHPPGRAWEPFLFRCLALPLLAIGGWWGASVLGSPVPPTTATLARLEGNLDQSLVHNDLNASEALADAALKIAPLDWHLYFQRGYAEAFQPGRMARAGADFKLARELESNWAAPCFEEGSTWLAVDEPDLCLDAWQEALRRASPTELPDLYRHMVELSTSNEPVHAGLLDYALGKIDEELIFIGYATPDETSKIIAAILARDPDLRSLDVSQRDRLFSVWWLQGNRDDLITRLAAHPTWLDAGWPYLAQYYAAQKDFQQAWETVSRYSPSPLIPKLATDRSIDDLTSAFYDRKNDLASGIMLYLAQRKKGQNDDALATLRALEKFKNCPRYVFYLEARLWAERQQWELAWDAWSKFSHA